MIVETAPSRIIVLAGILAIIVVSFMVYIPAIKAGFIWDDDKYVTENPLITAPGGLYRIWFSRAAPSQYFPLTYSTFWIEYRLWGFNPMGFHIVNVTIHILNALLLWLILTRLSIPGAWFASALFALHPVNVESVAWVTERKNVLMLFFSLLSVLCWVKFVLDDKSGRRATLFYIASLLFCALALCSKATACTLPVALVLILWLKRIPLTARRWLQVVPYLVMAIGMGIIVMWWEKNHQGTGLVNLGLTPADKLLIAGRALWFYLAKLFWPANLTFSYPRWHINAGEFAQYIWPAGIAAAGVIASLLRKRIGRPAIAAIVFFPAMLLPMLGFFSLYTFVYSFVADHYQYVASIGPIALVSAGGALLLPRFGKIAKVFMLSASAVLLLILVILTYRQCRIYTSPETLWQDTLRKNPDSWLASGQLGKMLFEQNKFNEAKPYLEQAIKLSPYMKSISPNIPASLHCNLAIILEAQNKPVDAISHYLQSIDASDNFMQAHYRLAILLANRGNIEQARPHFLRALELVKADKNDQLADDIYRWLSLLDQKSKSPGNRNPKP